MIKSVVLKRLIGLALISGLALACTNENSDLYVPKVKEKLTDGTVTDTAKAIVHEPNRDVDILFVIDQSASMAAIIKEVHENIDQFANQFTTDDKTSVNFRIGITTAWDSKHFEQKLPSQWIENKQEFFANSEIWPNLNFDLKQGRLKALKIDGEVNHEVSPYITAETPNLYETLRETLKVDAEIYKYEVTQNQDHLRNVFQLTQSAPFLKNTAGQSIYGPSPENEEFFTTLRKMVSPENRRLRNNINKGFPNPNANQLAVFIITDADDDTRNRHNITPTQIHRDLVSFMGNDPSKVVVYGAVYESGRDNCQVRKLDEAGNFEIEPEYTGGHPGIDGVKNPNYVNGQVTYKITNKKRDPGLNGSYNAPKKIEELVRLSGGQVKSICSSDFGGELASVGFNIREKTLEQKDIRIDLKAAFDLDTISVFYGDQEIGFDSQNGWSLEQNPNSDTVIVISKDAYAFEEDKQFKINFNKLTTKNIKKDEF